MNLVESHPGGRQSKQDSCSCAAGGISDMTLFRRSVSTRRRAAGRLDADNLAEEDIDDQEITVNLSSTGRLIDDELLSFVNVYFSNEILAHDAYHTRHATHPEVNRNGKAGACECFDDCLSHICAPLSLCTRLQALELYG